ncbi:ceramidase domain-containing protein [Dinoroseobacter sp. S124A]|uniref:ceramidase domain-containing protein n=1 Tax=Dinoroseobacter sp. S124A TaxID=3415128 RepID=UPI003C7A0836
MEGLWRQIDGYCERLDPGYWAEPVNAVTNAAFVLVAWVMWRRVRGQGLPLAELLCLVLALIGMGSFLFHTHAQVWAAIADVVPIVGFSLLYIYVANRHFWGWPGWAAALGALAYLPYSALLTPVFAGLPFFGISSFYWPLPVLIFGYAVLLSRRAPATARGLTIGAGMLCLSLVARSLDMPVCGALPLGTHFLWHILNALMLGWMIELYRRHMLAGPVRQG